MKKIILEILLGLGLPAAIFHTQLTGVFTAEKPVSKQISYSITRDTNYSLQAYDKTVADVQVYVFTVQNKKQHIVWHKQYNAMQVKNYPTNNSLLQQTVHIKNMHDAKEQLYITYIITYNTGGKTMQVQNGTSLLKGEKAGRLMIEI